MANGNILSLLTGQQNLSKKQQQELENALEGLGIPGSIAVGGGFGFIDPIVRLLLGQLQAKVTREELDEEARQFRQTFGLSEQQFREMRRQFNKEFGLSQRQFQESIRQFNQQFREMRRQFNLQFGLERERFGLEEETARRGFLQQLVDIMGNPRDVGRQAALVRQTAGSTPLATAAAQGQEFVGPNFQSIIDALQLGPNAGASLTAQRGAKFTLAAPHVLVNQATGQVTARAEPGEEINVRPQPDQQPAHPHQPGQRPAPPSPTGGTGPNRPPQQPAPQLPIPGQVGGETPGVLAPNQMVPVETGPPKPPVVIPERIVTPMEFLQVWSQVEQFIRQSQSLGQQLSTVGQFLQAVPPAAASGIISRLREIGMTQLADALENADMTKLEGTSFRFTGQGPQTVQDVQNFLQLGFVPAPHRIGQALFQQLPFEVREQLLGGVSGAGRTEQGFTEDLLRSFMRGPRQQPQLRFGAA